MTLAPFDPGKVAESARVSVSLGERSYEIELVSSDWSRLGECASRWLKEHGAPRALLITDEHLVGLHLPLCRQALELSGWEVREAVVPSGEPSKSLEQAARLYDSLVDFRADRQTVIVALGGGVVGDLAGFVAATYNRGLPFLQVPTTLLAQVDSSVGGKVGINHPKGKNLIGAFHQPIGVFIDTDTLQTLPDRDYRSGLAEVVKYGVALDWNFFDYLESNVASLNAREPSILRVVIARCCQLKGDVVEQDEFERTGLRAVLNYGHTFAHAYESLAGYGQLLHGEAVAIGMSDACSFAVRRGMVEGDLSRRQDRLLQNLGLPTRLPVSIQAKPQEILRAMYLDKKASGGKLRFILPTAPGLVSLVREIDDSEVLGLLEERLPWC